MRSLNPEFSSSSSAEWHSMRCRAGMECSFLGYLLLYWISHFFLTFIFDFVDRYVTQLSLATYIRAPYLQDECRFGYLRIAGSQDELYVPSWLVCQFECERSPDLLVGLSFQSRSFFSFFSLYLRYRSPSPLPTSLPFWR